MAPLGVEHAGNWNRSLACCVASSHVWATNCWELWNWRTANWSSTDRKPCVERPCSKSIVKRTNSEFDDAVPNPRHRIWAWSLIAPILLVLAALVLVPAAGTNALVRWLMPWNDTPRYTFAQLEQVPDSMVVPFAEPFDVNARLSESTAWEPRAGIGSLRQTGPGPGRVEGWGVQFEIPPQKIPDNCSWQLGMRGVRFRLNRRPARIDVDQRPDTLA